MGVRTTGPTLEIQLIADVARLQRDMGDMQKIVKSASVNAGQSFDDLARSSAASATVQAASAQKAAAAATGWGRGLSGVGNTSRLAAYQVQNLTFQLNDVVTGLASGQAPMRVLAQQGGQFYQIMQQSNLGVRGFATALLEMAGVLKVTSDAELAATAAATAAAAAEVKRQADSAAALLVTKEARAANLKTQYEAAVATEGETAALRRLVAAQRAAFEQSAKLAGIQQTLATTTAEATAAAEASSAATVTSIGRMGVVAGVATAALALLGLAFGSVKQGAEEIDPSAQKLIATLGLTDDQIKKLKDTTVTWGDVGVATFQLLAERAGINATAIGAAFGSAFRWAGQFAKAFIAALLGAFGGLVEFVASAANNIGLLVGKGVAWGVNKGLDAIEMLINGVSSGLNTVSGVFQKLGVDLGTVGTVNLKQFHVAVADNFTNPFKDGARQAVASMNLVMGGFDAISVRASANRDKGVIEQAKLMKATDAATGATHRATAAHHAAAGAHRAAAKAASDQSSALDKLAEAEKRAHEAALKSIATNNDEIEKLKLEIQLVEASNRTRTVALALLEAEQKIKNERIGRPEDQSELIRTTLERANLEATLKDKQDASAAATKVAADAAKAQQDVIIHGLQAIADQAQITGQALADAFGKPGAVLGDMLAGMADYRVQDAKLAQDVIDKTITQATADKELANIRAHNTVAALSGLKGLFKEHSTGYKVMQAAERAYAAFQAATTIAAMIRDTAHTTSSVANSATRAAADEAAGASKIFSQLGVYAFPVVAAMVALLATFAFGGHGGGGSSGPVPTSPEDLQKAAGAGTVLGDSTAKSASIANALELMAKNSTKGLDYSSDMVRALRGIEGSIGNLTATVARQLQLQGGFFDTAGKVGSSGGGGFLGMFAKAKTTSLYDQGLNFNAASVGQIVEHGITGATYQVLQTVKKNSGFFGIGGSTKTSYSTSRGALDGDIAGQVQAIVGQLRDSVVEAAKVLGLDVAAALDTFQVAIGTISFKDLTGDQITDQLNAVFSKVGDQMAGFAVAGLADFQKAGEGMFETLMRLAKDYLTVDAALKSIGMAFPTVGAASIAARERLIDLAGGLDDFVDQVNFFSDHFLSDADKLAFAQSQVDRGFAAIGMTAPASIDAFKQLVQGLDLSTDAGQSTFAALMEVAPAFYDVASAADALAKKQQDLTVQLLQAQGKAEEATALQRQIALAALDPSLRALQQQVYDAQDAAAAAAAAAEAQKEAEARREQASEALRQAYQRQSAALQSTIDKFAEFARTLREFRDSLFAPATTGSTAGALIALLRQGGLALGGDEGALGGGLQGAAQQYLDVATANAHSLIEVQRARALVARTLDGAIGAASGKASLAERQLDAMTAQVGRLIDINDSVLSVRDAIAALRQVDRPPSAHPVGEAGTGDGPASKAERAEKLAERMDAMVRHLAEIRAATRGTAVASKRTSRVLGNADRGGSLAIGTDSDTPIATVPA